MSQNVKILIVEDERIVAEDIKRSLKNLGYGVCGVVASGPDALKQVKKHDPNLVLMDIVLKGDMSGIETADRIHAMHDIPVVYLTAYADSDTLERAKVTQPFGYLLKPFEDRELASVIEMALYKHNTDKRLKESEARYRTLFEDSWDAIYITEYSGRFVVVNQSMRRLFGYSEEEMHQLNVQDLYAFPEDRIRFQSEIEEKGSVRDYEVRLKSNDNRVLDCIIAATLRHDKDGALLGYQGIIHDMTSRKLAEEEKMKMQAQLIQAQKMEAVGILAGGIAHDFNNLLTVIQGNCEMGLLKTTPDAPEYKELTEIRLASERAADLTGQLLLFSRKQPMKFISADLNRTVEDLLKMLHRLIGEDVGINTHLEDGLWTVLVDRGTMEQVIMNLAINARDAMPKGGNLIIKTQAVDLDEDAVGEMSKGHTGRFVKLSVEDTGSGMSPETIEHIFEPFFSTKGPGKGTGLGLSVVYGIIEQHEGWIDVRSEEGVGTTFDIFLPARSDAKRDEGGPTVSMLDLEGHGEGILLVEDEAGVRKLAGTLLTRAGYVVYEAMNAAEAFRVYEKEKKHIRLALCDVVLPDKNGVEIVEDLLSRNSRLGVLLSSGYTGSKSQWSLIQERGYPFLQKPYSMRDLLGAVKAVLESQRSGKKKVK